MINIFIDLQTLHNYSVRTLGKYGEKFMHQKQLNLQNQSPIDFYSNYPSVENFQKIINIIEAKCSHYN